MAKYTRMIVMSMSNEEIAEVLEKEGESLPDYTVYMMVEELKRRKEASLEECPEEELEAMEEQTAQDEAQDEALEEELEEEYRHPLDFEELFDPDPDRDLSDEELAEKKRRALEEEQASRKKTLILALAATGVTALAIVGFVIYVAVSGQL
jgi:hypothetical protein